VSDGEGWRPSPTPTAVGGLSGGLAGLLLLLPWLRPGSLLVRDLVAVADPAWSTRLLAPTGRLPRDVPGETLVALAGQLVPGDLVVRVVLLVAFVALGAGVVRVAAVKWSPAAAAVAGLAVVYNPWVWSRLQQGQWLVVVAVAALPWVVADLADDRRWRLARSAVLAGLTGFVALVVVAPTVVVVGVVLRRWAGLATALGVLALLAIPYLVVTPALAPDPDGFVAFAPSADLLFGVGASLLGGGGYFNTAVASPWRGTTGIGLVAVAVAVVAASGAWAWWAAAPAPARPRRSALLLSGVLALVLVWASTTPTVQGWAMALVDDAPWMAVARDSHRLLAPWILVAAVGAGQVVQVASERVVRAWPAVLVAGLLVVALPDPVVGPRLPPPSELPASWLQAAERIERGPPDGAVLVVPGGATQAYDFTGWRPTAVPLTRMVGREVFTDTRLAVRDAHGELLLVDDLGRDDPTRALAADLPASDGGALAAAGIGWVVVTDPDLALDRPPAGVTEVLRSPTLQLLEVEPARLGPQDPVPPWVLAVDLLVALVAVALLVAGRRDRDVPAPSERTGESRDTRRAHHRDEEG
jgi:hypothetical protein